MAELLRVSVYNDKYTVIQEEDGSLRALRYGEEWRDLCGDGLVLALAQEVDSLREGKRNGECRVCGGFGAIVINEKSTEVCFSCMWRVAQEFEVKRLEKLRDGD